MKQVYKLLFSFVLIFSFGQKAFTQDSCRSDFGMAPTSSPLTKVFTAQPWHSSQKPVEQICWKYGDGQDTCLTAVPGAIPPLTITHTYAQPGTYNVCIKIKYQGGCVAELCRNIQAGNNQPDSCKADYIISGANTFPFAGVFNPIAWHNNNKPVIEVRWDFNDGTPQVFTPTLAPVTHVYNSPGTYNICVRIKYDGGCVAEKCKPLVVSNNNADSCQSNFTVSAVNTSPLTRSFTPQTWHSNNKPVTEVRWTFGDGTTQTTATPVTVTHTYAVPGTYTVCIRIKYDGGCISEKCKPVVISNPVADSCKADYAVTAANTSPLHKIFTAIPWHNNQKPPIQICWNFGDGQDTCINAAAGTPLPLSIAHSYAQSGTYNVCVKIKYDGGCVAEKCKLLVIGTPVIDSCKAEFQVLQTSNNNLIKHFVAQPWHSNNKKPQQICWKFGDGQDTCINYDTSYTGAYNVTHQYQQSGLYQVCIKIKYFGGCVAEKCKPVQAGNPPTDSCQANFEVMPIAGTILSKTFVAQPWHSQNKRPEQICWKFGDGHDTCINYNPNLTYNYIVHHTYAQAGSYVVCVKIKYSGGCVAEKCKPVQVGPNTPTDSCSANFETTHYSTNPKLKKFTALPWHNNGKRPEKICWIFGDGKDTCINYNPANPNNIYSVLHLYSNNGPYTVCVKIKYQGGCEAQKCKVVWVGPQPGTDSCKANFTQEFIQNNYKWRRFNAQPWHSGNKRPEKICWIFGDGKDTCINYNPATPSVYTVLHLYQQPGIYNVCVKIKYQGGCEAQYCRPVEVLPQPCKALFTDSMISRFKVKFKGQAVLASPLNPVVSWTWSFGDGTTGTGQNVIHEYAQPGAYNVCLKIRTLSGCEDTYCRVKLIDSTLRILHLTPNPVQNVLYITYYSFYNQPAQIKIFNIYGVLVRTFYRNMTVGYNNFNTDVSTLPPGPYSLVVQSATSLASSVFFKY
jgi:PKD repeat protein